MLSYLSCLVAFSCTFALQTLANSDVNSDAITVSETRDKSSKSGDMPASVVILLLLMFIALGFIGIRYIKREYIQQQSYLFRKQAGTLFNNDNNKSYGSTFAPQLNADNIDEYIDDQLYGNNIIFNRINYYRQLIQQRVTNYMEQTPEPVLYEVVNDKNVSAYCNNPQIPNNPNYQPKTFENSPDYDPNTSPGLQQMFQANYERNQRKNDMENEYKVINENNNNNNDQKISVCHRFNNDDFNECNNSASDYDAIPDHDHDQNNNNAYSDSDKNISDSDNGNAENHKKQNDKPELTHKVVVLDLD